MVRLLSILCVLVIGCGEVVHTWDAGPDIYVPPPDGGVVPALLDVHRIDIGKLNFRPDAGPHKCSPSGYYVMYVRVMSNSCPESIIEKNSWWTKPSFHKSYWCGTYFWDDGATLDGDRTMLCWNYMEVTIDGLESWSDCTVYESDWKIFCEFSIRTPLTRPQ